jgi:hypothetical protein
MGLALEKNSQDKDILHALFNVLETQNIIDGEANITLIQPRSAPSEDWSQGLAEASVRAPWSRHCWQSGRPE